MAEEAIKRQGTNSALRDFLKNEAAGGIVLMAAAAIALFVANSPLYPAYHGILESGWGFSVSLGGKIKEVTLHLFINDALMAIFFLLVGLEIKREFVDGRLNSWDRRRLPVVAAAAGMFVPAGIYLFIVSGNATLNNGWAIPAATDIAFAIGVLALLGKRAPASLKLFLVTVAIVDDMGAVAIIALVYTAKINTVALLAALAVLAVMFILNRSKVLSLWIYIPLALVLWWFVLLSGVHATIAGVLAAMMIPIVKTPGEPDAKHSPLHKLEHGIAPWSAFLIVPIFGFANAGVNVAGLGAEQIFAPLPLGIAAGLFFGKQIGIFGSVWIACKTGFADRLGGASWLQVYGVSMLCGIGFTMSLFIGALAFPGDPLLIEEAKIGVLMGSGLSAIVGYLVLRLAPQEKHVESLGETEADALLDELSDKHAARIKSNL